MCLWACPRGHSWPWEWCTDDLTGLQTRARKCFARVFRKGSWHPRDIPQNRSPNESQDHKSPPHHNTTFWFNELFYEALVKVECWAMVDVATTMSPRAEPGTLGCITQGKADISPFCTFLLIAIKLNPCLSLGVNPRSDRCNKHEDFTWKNPMMFEKTAREKTEQCQQRAQMLIKAIWIKGYKWPLKKITIMKCCVETNTEQMLPDVSSSVSGLTGATKKTQKYTYTQNKQALPQKYLIFYLCVHNP